jgi:hypothetical protein
MAGSRVRVRFSRRSSRLPWRHRAAAALGVCLVTLVGGPGASGDDGMVTSAALSAGPRQMAEAAVAVDPTDEAHLVAAADPYLQPVRIVVAETRDGGASWLPPAVVVPEGFAKSYDPSVAVSGDGEMIVVGGASGVGSAHCQPGSAVFLATLRSGRSDYQIVRDARSDGAYVDRPRFAVSPRSGRRYVTWTESSGPAANCRGMPLQSTTMFTRSRPDRSFEPARPLPGSGLPAPFGSSLAIGDSGMLAIVVAEFDPAKRQRVLLYTSRDEGATIAGPVVVGEGPPVPTRIPDLGGFVAPVPTVAISPDGRTAVAWTEGVPGDIKIRVLQSTATGAWQDISPPAVRPEYFPAVSYDGKGRLWLLTAAVDGGAVDFQLRSHRTQEWDDPLSVGAGPAGGYVELGQFLGLTTAGHTLATAVPVDGPTGSALRVSVRRADKLSGASPALSSAPAPRFALQRPQVGPHEDTATRAGGSRPHRPPKWRRLPWAIGALPASYFVIRGRHGRRDRRRPKKSS